MGLSDGPVLASRQTNMTGGSTTLPRVPPPINHQPMGTNNRTAQCHWMRPLVPIGLGCASSGGNGQFVSCRGTHFPHLSVDSTAVSPSDCTAFPPQPHGASQRATMRVSRLDLD